MHSQCTLTAGNNSIKNSLPLFNVNDSNSPKLKIMQQQVMSITRNLLNSGAFNHLSDAALTRLQWLLMARNNVDTTAQLMKYWYSANYYTTGVPQDLLYNCNLLLMYSGKPSIDVLVMDEVE
jgi:hypothetical protein